MNNTKAFIAIDRTGETVAFVAAMNRVEAARRFRRMGIEFVTVEAA